LASDASKDLELCKVIKSWPGLPHAIKAGIVAMVRASLGGLEMDMAGTD